jgi:uncharacterized membrane protein
MSRSAEVTAQQTSSAQITPGQGTRKDERIDAYLSRLEAALAGVAASDKEDILREIRAHIVDSADGATDRDGAVDRVLRMLGTPEELAERYRTECLLTRASRSFSPWLLLRTCWRWAMLGAKGTVAFLLAMFGYSTALALTVSIFLKPFMPSRVGLWVGRHGLNVGVPAHPEQMHELLGEWFVPVIAVTAFVVAIGTTQALRWMIRKRSSESVGSVLRANVSATSAV